MRCRDNVGAGWAAMRKEHTGSTHGDYNHGEAGGEHRKPLSGGRNPDFENTWSTVQQSLCKGVLLPLAAGSVGKGECATSRRLPLVVTSPSLLEIPPVPKRRMHSYLENRPKPTSSSLSTGSNYLSGVPVQTV